MTVKSGIGIAKNRNFLADKVYLSLGNREEKTNNRIMARVGDNIRLQKELLDRQDIEGVLEWNEGNHFSAVEERTAKGFRGSECVDGRETYVYQGI